MAEIIAVVAILSLATGGSPRLLMREPFKGDWALLVLLPVQALWPDLSSRLGINCALSMVMWLLMMIALVVVIALNTGRRPVLAVAALGIAANVLVIALNGAMPVSIEAASEIGGTRAEARAVLAESCLHEEIDAGTRLAVLADVIAVPGPEWQRSVLSIGDVLLSLGLGGWVFAASRRPRV